MWKVYWQVAKGVEIKWLVRHAIEQVMGGCQESRGVAASLDY